MGDIVIEEGRIREQHDRAFALNEVLNVLAPLDLATRMAVEDLVTLAEYLRTGLVVRCIDARTMSGEPAL